MPGIVMPTIDIDDTQVSGERYPCLLGSSPTRTFTLLELAILGEDYIGTITILATSNAGRTSWLNRRDGMSESKSGFPVGCLFPRRAKRIFCVLRRLQSHRIWVWVAFLCRVRFCSNPVWNCGSSWVCLPKPWRCKAVSPI